MRSDIQVFPTTTLGNNTYLLAVGRDAALVDPQWDAWRFLAAAESQGLTIRYVLETHVHNDHVSGALEVRAATGAEVVAPARGAYRFPHRGMAEGDKIDLGGVVLQAMETPGHTPEHLAYLLSEAGRPVAVFTGGSLLLGSAGRTDLFGKHPRRPVHPGRSGRRGDPRPAPVPVCAAGAGQRRPRRAHPGQRPGPRPGAGR